MDNDITLVQAAQRGDKRAFTQLVEKHEQRVYNLARKMMRDQQDAEDVLQETFISVFRHLKDFQGDSSFATWLYRIATNASLMKLRGRKAPPLSLDEPLESDDDAGALPREIVDWGITPEEALLNGETRAQTLALAFPPGQVWTRQLARCQRYCVRSSSCATSKDCRCKKPPAC